LPPFVASSARGSTSIEPPRRGCADGSDHKHDLLDVAAEIDKLGNGALHAKRQLVGGNAA